MERRYEFRYNTVLNDLEYRQRNSIHFYFRPVDRRVRNTVAINALKEGIRAWDRDVERYLTSEYVSLYNPVEEYLCSVGRWDGKDRIRALANLVPCNNPHWRELFYRWFLSMVAHWRGSTANMETVRRHCWLGRRGIVSLPIVALFCRLNCVLDIRIVLILRANRMRSVIWGVFCW